MAGTFDSMSFTTEGYVVATITTPDWPIREYVRFTDQTTHTGRHITTSLGRLANATIFPAGISLVYRQRIRELSIRSGVQFELVRVVSTSQITASEAPGPTPVPSLAVD